MATYEGLQKLIFAGTNFYSSNVWPL